MAKMTGCTSYFDRVERLVDELRTVIDLNQVEASSSLAQLLEYTCHTGTWQREADADVRALPIPRVDEGQHSNAPAVRKCVRDAVYCPTLVYAIGCRSTPLGAGITVVRRHGVVRPRLFSIPHVRTSRYFK